MKSRGIDEAFSVFCLLAIVIISINFNIADFWNGQNGKINLITLAATTVYIIYCSAFALFAHKRKSLITMTIWAVITLIFAIYILLKATSVPMKPGSPFVIPFLVVFLSPFQGLTAVLSNNRLVIFSLISIISTLWIILSVLRLRLFRGRNGRACRAGR